MMMRADELIARTATDHALRAAVLLEQAERMDELGARGLEVADELRLLAELATAHAQTALALVAARIPSGRPAGTCEW